MGGPMGGSSAPLAPEKGVFPLDHFGECKKTMRSYLSCLKRHGNDASACRELSRAYLACRMDRELMSPQPLEELGFSKEDATPGGKRRGKRGGKGEEDEDATRAAKAAAKPQGGFVGGMKHVEGQKTERRTRRIGIF
jgi:cytochrome c oxidase assembly protein subunit 19